MSSVVRNKKIIMSWNSYENMFKHMDMHDLYLEWQFDQIDALNLTSIDDSPISVSWWCEQEMLSNWQ